MRRRYPKPQLVDLCNIAYTWGMENVACLLGAQHALEKLGLDKAPGFTGPIQKQTVENQNYRKVLFTGKNIQLVVMHVKPGEDLGMETHPVDQFFRIDQGDAIVVRNGVRTPVKDNDAFIIPAGVEHNVINASNTKPLGVYTLYAPPHHPDGAVHKTKADAIAAEAKGKDKPPPGGK